MFMVILFIIGFIFIASGYIVGSWLGSLISPNHTTIIHNHYTENHLHVDSETLKNLSK